MLSLLFKPKRRKAVLALMKAAKAAGMSLNQWGVRIIEEATQGEASGPAQVVKRVVDTLGPAKQRRLRQHA